jgi:hypothetical protein
MKKLNKKADGISWPAIFGMFIFLVVLFIILFNVVTKNNTALNVTNNLGYDCQKSGGYCTVPSEGCANNYTVFAGLTNCDINTPTCCKPIISTTPSTECTGKKQGQSCGNSNLNSVCDQFGACVTKCEYCSRFPSDPLVCYNKKNSKGVIVNFDRDFKCACTRTICEEKEKDGKCIKSYCEQSNANYCCE